MQTTETTIEYVRLLDRLLKSFRECSPACRKLFYQMSVSGHPDNIVNQIRRAGARSGFVSSFVEEMIENQLKFR